MSALLEILGKPDNLPIALLLLGSFAAAFAIVLLARRGEPRPEPGLPPRVSTWPYLVRVEMLAAILVTALLVLASVALDAPLEEAADPTETPNPAKAPWYFVGLQELLVYFDPWIAGVVVPTVIVFGLMAIPYLDPNPRGSGRYTIRERPFALGTFGAGFLLWVGLIVVGTFCRGPGWQWFWPWEPWDPHRVVAEATVDLAELFGIRGDGGRTAFGAAVVGAWFLGGTALPYAVLRWRRSPALAALGPGRYLVIALLLLAMAGVVAKITLRLALHVKYVWTTPWFNV